MAKKKNNNHNNGNNNDGGNHDNNKNEGGEKKNKDGGDGEKKKDEKSPITVVLKVDMHCEGCASKISKCVRSFEGVEAVKAEAASNKLTIVGAVDPSKIRDKLHEKTKKKVELISPQPKKDKENIQKPDNNQSKDKTADDKKTKEPPVTTAVLKLALHCQGCIEKIHKTVTKTKGVLGMSVDKQKELVTVKGTMDVKALTEALKERLKRPVEIVPPKKEKEEKESNGGDNSGGGGGGGGKKKKKGGGGGDGAGDGEKEAEGGGGDGGGVVKMEGNRMEHMVGFPGSGYGYPYQNPIYEYGPGYQYGYPVGPVYPPQIFSDENPNACSIM